MALPWAYMAATFAISAAKGGIGMLGKNAELDEKDRQAKKAWKAKKRSVMIANQQEQARVNRTNEYIKKIWDQKINNYNQQLKFNQEAAFRGYIGEQMKAMDEVSAFMFEQTDFLAELTREAGQSAARGFTSRSAQLAEMKDVYGAYYRNRMMSANNLGRSLEATQGAMENISREEYQANLNAHQEVAVQPMLEVFRPTAMPDKPSPMQRNTGLRIGSVLASAGLDAALAAAPAIGRETGGGSESYINERYGGMGPEGDGIPQGEIPGAFPPLPGAGD